MNLPNKNSLTTDRNTDLKRTEIPASAQLANGREPCMYNQCGIVFLTTAAAAAVTTATITCNQDAFQSE